MKIDEFDYDLPKELIAQYPAQKRSESRMEVLNRKSESVEHKGFSSILTCLNKGDCLVLNNTKVINARLVGKSETSGKAEVFILERLNGNSYKVLLKPSGRLKNKKIYFDNGVLAKVIKAENPESIVEFDRELNLNLLGKTPLPPYIKREAEQIDKSRYQTVYAKHKGATASPTAGLHFTNELLDEIQGKGIEVVYVTLHVSYGTFAPVLEEDIEKLKMHREYFELPWETIEIIQKAKSDKKKVVAVGTTTTRVLESGTESRITPVRRSLGVGGNHPCPPKPWRRRKPRTTIKGWTDLFIYPGYKFKVVDSLLTNFHLPKSTLIMLVSAFAGREFILRAYREAIKEKYRFFSYGDCMLIM